ncbi:MAG: HU family DNA-binding protein [Alphaproteobacteria bacterium]|nr:HU family DNA-binding protein [Alphaproteobacteria bacterium]
MAQTLVLGEDFDIRAIGRFRVKTTAPRMGRNPRTGESVAIPAGRKVAFAPSTVLKRRVNFGETDT